ncbi:MAG: DUF4890 domain-containing protein [Bacteroides sp.]|nr:DUF4890 domain-containing protein [Bacteroides sp.]
MKRLSFLMAILLMAGTLVMANGNQHRNQRRGKEKSPKEHAERITERMVKEYSLNDTQKAQLLELNLSMAEKKGEMPKHHARKHPGKHKRDAKRNDGSVSGEKKNKDKDSAVKPEVNKEKRAERMQAMKESREAYDAKLKEIMTKDQYATYTKKQAERAEKMKERREKRMENKQKQS